MSSSLHVPAPGRVQFYGDAEMPFVRQEDKAPLRIPDEFAMSKTHLRYLGKIRYQTRYYLRHNVGMNYFTGHKAISLGTTLQQAEVMYHANPEVKDLASSGDLKALHEQCNALGDKCEADYNAQRDRIENLVESIKNRENKIYETLINNHGLDHLKLHGQFGGSLFDVLSYASSGATVENLNHLATAIECGAEVQSEFNELAALLGAKAQAFAGLHKLHKAYTALVEDNDAAAVSELQSIHDSWQSYQTAMEIHSANVDPDQGIVSQIDESAQSLDAAVKTFGEFRTAVSKRHDLFLRFRDNEAAQQDSLEGFAQGLIQHLSQSIVVREHRDRYQVEQFDRMMAAGLQLGLRR